MNYIYIVFLFFSTFSGSLHSDEIENINKQSLEGELNHLGSYNKNLKKSPLWQQALNALSDEDRTILEIFFRLLLKDTNGGYVLYGSKPLLTEQVFSIGEKRNEIGIISKWTRFSVILQRGFRIWNKLPFKSQNYLIQSYHTPVYGAAEFIFANKQSFFHVIEQNLTLFQYALGPEVSSQGLWSQLKDSNQTFSSIFKNEKVLFGIVFGYGTQNALKVSREEYVDDNLYYAQNILPLKSSHTRATLIASKQKPRLDRENFFLNYGISPSFGFTHLKEEEENLANRIAISLEKYSLVNHTLPRFAYYQSKESEQLLKRIAKHHQKIQ